MRIKAELHVYARWNPHAIAFMIVYNLHGVFIHLKFSFVCIQLYKATFFSLSMLIFVPPSSLALILFSFIHSYFKCDTLQFAALECYCAPICNAMQCNTAHPLYVPIDKLLIISRCAWYVLWVWANERASDWAKCVCAIADQTIFIFSV